MTDTSSQSDQRNLRWLSISDFSPGIYYNSAVAVASPPNTLAGLFPAPPGAADASATFGCIALANGGLGPLPGLFGSPGATGLSLDDMGISATAVTDITALINSFQDANDELIVGVTEVTSGSQVTSFYSYLVGLASLHTIQTQSYTFTTNKNFCCFPFHTYIEAQTQPVVCLPLAAPDGPNSNLMIYPDPTAPSVVGVAVIETNATADGTSFGHQGRIVVNSLLTASGWPVAKSYSANEFFNYTDPAQSETWPTQAEVFGPEAPFGYGAVNSVSAGELFAIKCRGGAIIVQGDLNNPTVTQLPGVQSTGLIYGRTDTDQNGMYYCSDRQGAWVWNGGNASTKISTQLDDNFYMPEDPISPGPSFPGEGFRYYGYYCQRWSDWMLFSNNWVFDSLKGTWWRLEDPNLHSYFYYIPGFYSEWMFAALMTVSGGAEKFLFEYNLSVPRNLFTWQSLPLRLPTYGQTGSVREVVLRASNPYDDTAPQIVVELIDDKGNTTTLDTWLMTPGIDDVQEARLNCRLSQTTTVAVKVTASGAGFAPVLYGIDLGYRTREHLGVT